MLALAILVALYWLPRDLNTDVYDMLELADNFFAGGYRVLGEPHSRYMPLYPFLLALGHDLVRLPWLPSTRLIALVFSSLTPVVIWFWPREDGENRTANLLGALLLCFSGFDIIQGTQAGTDQLLGFWVLLGFLLFRKGR